MNRIALDTVVSRKTGQITADMDGETVMMSMDTSRYYNLGKTGSVIWSLIESPTPVGEVILNLMKEYDVPRQQCEAETIAFLEELQKEKLIETA